MTIEFLTIISALLCLMSVAISFYATRIASKKMKIVVTRKLFLDKKVSKQWFSRLFLLGEGGAGKTSLLRSISEEMFISGLETTHGIGVKPLDLAHPEDADVNMTLNCWDFGGQSIYHATHQFFMSSRSLYILVWDARHGWEAGKLYYWLDTINARAPKSPVMVVAAHIDERDADFPAADLKRKYPQIVDFYQVSNKEGTGIEDLRNTIAKVAANAELMPLMGNEWPKNWLDVADAITKQEANYISLNRLYELMAEHNVKDKSVIILTQLLHDLGVIIYFAEDDQLRDMVILDVQWVTKEISKVLESTKVIELAGVFTREHMNELWNDVESDDIRQYLLRLMERFDLSYRTLEDSEISIVVERLPLDPPDYQGRWDAIKQTEGCKEVSIIFDLSSLPVGLPTWFIARSHRFTTHTHWRLGALLVDSEEKRHLGLVVGDEYDRQIRLTVRGPAPHNFFKLLLDGLELTLARFPGLSIARTVPCPKCEKKDKSLAYEFEYMSLVNKLKVTSKQTIECHKCYEDVSIHSLLFGIGLSTTDEAVDKLGNLSKDVRVLVPEDIPRVFISSTGKDLYDYRKATESVCIDAKMFPVGMEHFEAMGVGATAGSLRKLHEADLYIGIFAHRYGYIEDGYEASVTECEFDHAGETDLDRLCFLVDEEYPWPPSAVDHENYSRLEDFKNRIDKQLIRAKFTTVENFSYQLLRSLLYWKQNQESKDGYRYSDQGKVIDRIDKKQDILLDGQGNILTEISNLRSLAQRQFLTLFNAAQRLEESHCPSVFAIMPVGADNWVKKIAGEKMGLHLYCQKPGHWHPTYTGGHYEFTQPAEWLRTMSPYIVKLARLMKYAAPLAGPVAGMASAAFAEQFKYQLKMMEELAKKLGDEGDIGAGELAEGIGKVGRVEQAEGAPLRALRELLDKVDTKHHWGGLKKILTPEGHYLWLCEDHAKEYRI